MNISYPNIRIWTLTSTLYLAKYIHVQKNFFKLVSNSVNLCELNICFVHCFCYFSHVHILSLVCTCISIPSLLGALIKKLWTLIWCMSARRGAWTMAGIIYYLCWHELNQTAAWLQCTYSHKPNPGTTIFSYVIIVSFYIFYATIVKQNNAFKRL